MLALLQNMGPLAWPLALCSVIALMLILERLSVFLRLPPLSVSAGKAAVSACRDCDKQACHGAVRGWRYGLALLLEHSAAPSQQREEVLGCWLLEERRRLNRQLRLLQLIAVLAPMLGLLGTVLGMLEMFANIAGQDRPVTPALLADGLWQALYTTVWGLLIAIPSMAAGQGFALWAERYLEAVQNLLNRCHLAIDGLNLDLTPSASRVQWALP
ncbi:MULTISPECIES: MotA/TolQ/ExbB proton channel family protein [Pseudomonas]|uniref:MotA/TolQ/ExbB proton channel family protein n=1 Tax=Pseudomonas TaxID=286 RepID=UPI0008F43FFC|nr:MULTISPECIES: MotA/TolQ/ExbB proton channel family protein [Pseudomonas]NRH27397.1 MotA/TolQ/ExbB proton channel family protein [Pseudomonas sp. MS19]SFU18325.1 biopolymer transport protein ExbB [Pseudomonas marincola]